MISYIIFYILMGFGAVLILSSNLKDTIEEGLIETNYTKDELDRIVYIFYILCIITWPVLVLASLSDQINEL